MAIENGSRSGRKRDFRSRKGRVRPAGEQDRRGPIRRLRERLDAVALGGSDPGTRLASEVLRSYETGVLRPAECLRMFLRALSAQGAPGHASGAGAGPERDLAAVIAEIVDGLREEARRSPSLEPGAASTEGVGDAERLLEGLPRADLSDIVRAARRDLDPAGAARMARIRAEMERYFRTTFPRLTVRADEDHWDPSLAARAFVQGDHVSFDPRFFDPGSPAGRRVIAHEFAHLAQQQASGAPAAPSLGALEADADASAAAFVAGADRPVRYHAAAGPAYFHDPEGQTDTTPTIPRGSYFGPFVREEGGTRAILFGFNPEDYNSWSNRMHGILEVYLPCYWNIPRARFEPIVRRVATLSRWFRGDGQEVTDLSSPVGAGIEWSWHQQLLDALPAEWRRVAEGEDRARDEELFHSLPGGSSGGVHRALDGEDAESLRDVTGTDGADSDEEGSRREITTQTEAPPESEALVQARELWDALRACYPDREVFRAGGLTFAEFLALLQQNPDLRERLSAAIQDGWVQSSTDLDGAVNDLERIGSEGRRSRGSAREGSGERDVGWGVGAGEPGVFGIIPIWLYPDRTELLFNPDQDRVVAGSTIEARCKIYGMNCHRQDIWYILPLELTDIHLQWDVQRRTGEDGRESVDTTTDSASIAVPDEAGTYDFEATVTGAYFENLDRIQEEVNHLSESRSRTFTVSSAEEVARADFESLFVADEGVDAPFSRDDRGRLVVRPGFMPENIQLYVRLIEDRMSSLRQARERGDISQGQLDDYLEYFQEGLDRLREIQGEMGEQVGTGGEVTESSAHYLVRGVFVNPENSQRTPLVVVLARTVREQRGETLRYGFRLVDLTMNPTDPVRIEVDPIEMQRSPALNEQDNWLLAEGRALEAVLTEYADENDFPIGQLHIAIQRQETSEVFERSYEVDTIGRRLQPIAAGVALVGGIALLAAAPLTGGATSVPALIILGVTSIGVVADIAFRWEDRISTGRFRADTALAMDILSVAGLLMGAGGMSRAVAAGGRVARFYYISAAGLDVANGFLVREDAIRQIRAVEAQYTARIADETDPERRAALMLERDQMVSRVIGQALLSGAMGAVSLAGNVRGYVQARHAGRVYDVREDVFEAGCAGPERARERLDAASHDPLNASEQRFLEEVLANPGTPVREGAAPADTGTAPATTDATHSPGPETPGPGGPEAPGGPAGTSPGPEAPEARTGPEAPAPVREEGQDAATTPIRPAPAPPAPARPSGIAVDDAVLPTGGPYPYVLPTGQSHPPAGTRGGYLDVNGNEWIHSQGEWLVRVRPESEGSLPAGVRGHVEELVPGERMLVIREDGSLGSLPDRTVSPDDATPSDVGPMETVETAAPRVSDGLDLATQVRTRIASSPNASGREVALRKLDEILAEANLANPGLRDEFLRELAARMERSPELGPWDAMRQVVRDDPGRWTCQGRPVPAAELARTGGVSKLITLRDVWRYHLVDAYRRRFGNDMRRWIQEMAENPAVRDEFMADPRRFMSGTITGTNETGWWFAADASRADTISGAVSELALEESATRYQSGFLRVDIPAGSIPTGGVRKPTAFDGINFEAFRPTDSADAWGRTSPGQGRPGAAEGVMRPVPVSSVEPGQFRLVTR